MSLRSNTHLSLTMILLPHLYFVKSPLTRGLPIIDGVDGFSNAPRVL